MDETLSMYIIRMIIIIHMLNFFSEFHTWVRFSREG